MAEATWVCCSRHVERLGQVSEAHTLYRLESCKCQNPVIFLDSISSHTHTYKLVPVYI
jgi:hypothetical protein